MTGEELFGLYCDALELSGEVKCPPRRRNLLAEALIGAVEGVAAASDEGESEIVQLLCLQARGRLWR